MNYSKIDLMQIERNDIPTLKHSLNKRPGTQMNTEVLNKEYFDRLTKHDEYGFTVRGLKEGGFGLILIGFGFVENIDWISRHCTMRFLNTNSVPQALDVVIAKKMIDFCFNELNLNKVYCDTYSSDHSSTTLASIGFVAEGSRREALFQKGVFQDITVYGLLAQEYRSEK